ncbi:MAG: stage III sporulation protein AB [Ruminococcus sp.]|nr:stage III sporulation protein AB [Ruminococcus sp.]
MLLRIIAAFMFAAAGAVSGFSKADKLRNDLELCRETGELLRISAINIRFQALDVYELSGRLKASSELCGLTFLKKLPDFFSEGENFHDQWKSSVLLQGNIPDDEQRILLGFGDMIGTSDIQGQLSSISSYEAEIEALERKRREDFLRKGRLYRSAGTLFGVMAGILII